jgi:hypothetical protein
MLTVFEKRVLRRISVSKMNEIIGGWRNLHNEELHNFYTSPSTIRMIKSMGMKWAGHVAHTGITGMHMDFGGKARKRRLVRPRGRWEDNVKIDLRGIGWGGIDCIHMAQDRDQWRALANTQ